MRFDILGPLRVVTEDGPVRLPGRRERTVLAVLLVNHDRVVPRDYLVEAVWDTAPPATAKRQVQNSVSTIRRFLVRGGAPADTLVGEDAGYRFRSRPGSLDVQEFHDRTATAIRLAREGQLDRAAAVLRSALDLWRGPALLGLTGRVVESAAAELEEQRLVALEQRVDLEMMLGRHHDLVAELTTLTAAHPLRERLCGQLMLALHRSGRQAEAVAAFHRIRARLDEELGLAPGAALQERYAEILRGTAGPARVPVDSTPPAQLPPDVPGFTGRAAHLARLDSLPDQPLWVITGMAGVGKTALAVHWGHRVRGRFPDGQLYVNLRGFAGGAPVTSVEALAHLLYALGTPTDQIPVDVDRAAGRYRSLLSGRRVLVILDDAADAGQVRPLLPGEPGCVVLVTSRNRLAGLVAVDGASHLPLDVLTDSEARSLLSRILGQERVSAEPKATATLVRQCSRLPLALRIAAANLARFPDIDGLVAVLAARDGLSGLEIEGDDRGGVRRTFDLSYQALAQDARRLFRMFGQVPCADLTAEVAAALTGVTTPEAMRLLDRLAAAHLVHEHVPGRFACHDLLRQYAEDLGTAEDPSEVVRRLDAWYLAHADRAAAVLYPHRVRLPTGSAGEPGPVDEVAALSWLDAERANLVAVVRHAADYGPRPTSWLLADTLRGYFWLRMHTVDWSQTAHAALRAAETAGDDHGQAAALLSIGDLHYRGAEHRQAAHDYERALALCGRAGWVDGEVAALGNLGILHQQAGRVRQAAEHYAEVLARCGAGGSASVRKITVPNALACLGLAHLELGRLATAAEYARQALDLYGELGWRAGEATVRNDLGRISRAAGRRTESSEHFTRGLALARELGDRGIESASLCGLATVHLDRRADDEAADYADAALALARETGDRRFEAEALNVTGALHHRRGQDRDALASHTRALDLSRTAGEPHLQAETLLHLATLHADLDRPVPAAEHARAALAVADQHGFELLARRARTIIGMVNA